MTSNIPIGDARRYRILGVIHERTKTSLDIIITLHEGVTEEDVVYILTGKRGRFGEDSGIVEKGYINGAHGRKGVRVSVNLSSVTLHKGVCDPLTGEYSPERFKARYKMIYHSEIIPRMKGTNVSSPRPVTDPNGKMKYVTGYRVGPDGKREPIPPAELVGFLFPSRGASSPNNADQKVLSSYIEEVGLIRTSDGRPMARSLADFELRMEPRLKGKINLILLNVTGVKRINDEYGHAAGNEFISKLNTEAIVPFFSKKGIIVSVSRDGGSFIIDLPADLSESAVQTLRADLVKEVKHTLPEGRARAVLYDGEGRGIDVKLWIRSILRETYRVNRNWDPEMEKDPVSLNPKVIEESPVVAGPVEHKATQLEGQINRVQEQFTEEKYQIIKEELKKRGISDPELIPKEQIRKIFDAQFKDITSGLLTQKAFVDRINQHQKAGKDVYLGMMDGNAVGPWGSYGEEAGEIMDHIVQKRYPEAAYAAFSDNFELFRHGTGSEEFPYIFDGSPEEIEAGFERFAKELKKPEWFKLDAAKLQRSEIWRTVIGKDSPYSQEIKGEDSLTFKKLVADGVLKKRLDGDRAAYEVDLTRMPRVKNTYYYITSGENWSAIAKKVGMPEKELRRANDVSAESPAPGKGAEVKIPAYYAERSGNIPLRIKPELYVGITMDGGYVRLKSSADPNAAIQIVDQGVNRVKEENKNNKNESHFRDLDSPRFRPNEIPNRTNSNPVPKPESKPLRNSNSEAKPGSRINLSNSAMLFGLPLVLAGLGEMDQEQFKPGRVAVNAGLGTGTALVFGAIEKRVINSGPSGATGTAGAFIALPMSAYSNWKDLSSLDPTKTRKGLVNVTADTEIGAFTGGIMPYVGLWGSMVVGVEVIDIKKSFENHWDGLTSSEGKKPNDAQSAVVWDSTLGWMKSPVESIHGVVSGSLGKTAFDLAQGNGFHPVNNYQAKKEDAKVAFDEAGNLLDKKGVTQLGKNMVGDLNWSFENSVGVGGLGGWALNKIDESKNTLLSKEEASKALASGVDGVELKFGENYKLDNGKSVLGATAKDLDFMGEILRGNYGVKTMFLDSDVVLNDFMRDSIMAAVRGINAEQPIKGGELHISFNKNEKTGKVLLSISVFNDGATSGKRVIIEADPKTVGGNIIKGERLPGVINARK